MCSEGEPVRVDGPCVLPWQRWWGGGGGGGAAAGRGAGRSGRPGLGGGVSTRHLGLGGQGRLLLEERIHQHLCRGGKGDVFLSANGLMRCGKTR